MAHTWKPGIGTGLVAVLLLLCLGGCGTYPHMSYWPRPASASYKFDEAGSAEVLARLSGVRSTGESEAKQPVMLVNLRVANHSKQALQLNPADLELVSGRLWAFPQPTLTPSDRDALTVEPGEAQMISAVFGFPGGVKPKASELRWVHLSVTLHSNGQAVTRGMAFRDADYFYPYYGYYGYYNYPPHYWRMGVGLFD